MRRRRRLLVWGPFAFVLGVEASACGDTKTPGDDANESTGEASSDDAAHGADSGIMEGDEGVESTGTMPHPDGPPVPPRSATRTCRFGAASTGDWVGAPDPVGLPFDVPQRLSEARCFTDLAALVPAPDVVPYEINAPLWTDGAHKHRYFVLPPGETIEVRPDGRWAFPVGSAILKVFAPERVMGDPESAVPIETRVMVRRPLDWAFYTYQWNADGTDAELVAGGEVVEVAVTDDGVRTVLPYYIPDEEACRVCHRWEDTGQVLGPRTVQVSRVLEYEHGPRNQLEVLWDAGWLSGIAMHEALAQPPITDPADVTAAVEDRARAYLHANCSHCHRKGGWQPVDLEMDLRYELPLVDTNICGVPLQYWSPWVGGAMRIDPGDPDNSNMLQRIEVRGDGQMPLIATYAVDPLGVEVMQAWVESLEGCPEPG